MKVGIFDGGKLRGYIPYSKRKNREKEKPMDSLKKP